jgi:hydroxypyruvate isomerase
MKVSVCADAVFRGRDPAEYLPILKDVGIDAMEFWSWWDKDLDALRALTKRFGVSVAAFCTRFVSLVDESQRTAYLEGLRDSLAVARSLGCATLITQVGQEMPGVSREVQHRSLVDGLKACVPALSTAGITLVFEPLNTAVDHKGYFLVGSDEAFTIAEEVASPWVKVLFDIYHQQISEGNLGSRIRRHIGAIGHFHAAGCPGRHELDEGEIRYQYLVDAIRSAGYGGFFGLEYFPLRDAREGLRDVIRSANG